MLNNRILDAQFGPVAIGERTLAMRHMHFRGCSENSVLQEFWISMLPANAAQAVKAETDGVIDAKYNCRDNKHKYQTNANKLMGYLSRHIDEYMDAEIQISKVHPPC